MMHKMLFRAIQPDYSQVFTKIVYRKFPNTLTLLFDRLDNIVELAKDLWDLQPHFIAPDDKVNFRKP